MMVGQPNLSIGNHMHTQFLWQKKSLIFSAQTAKSVVIQLCEPQTMGHDLTDTYEPLDLHGQAKVKQTSS